MLSPESQGLANLSKMHSLSFNHQERGSDVPLSHSDFHKANETQRLDCFPMTFQIDCSPEEIAKGRPILCRVEFPSARSDFKPVLKWSVSKGARKKASGNKQVEVRLTDARMATITVQVKVTSPRICLATASAELQVAKTIK
jgi:hypothetical protein